MGPLIMVEAAFDPEARVWFVRTSTLPGLHAEASSLEALRDKLPGLVEDLIEENGFEGGDGPFEVPIEVIAHTRAIARVPARS
jgi:hypothetical protein